MTIGERLRCLRLARNMSQQEVARHIGVTRSAYSHYEINNRQPVYSTLNKLALFFDVPIDYILNEDRTDYARETKQLLQLWHALDRSSRQHTLHILRQCILQPDHPDKP
ncbi:helix-turn-helix domain-containing protein [Paenibacillus apiarius]|uniref:Helix-turn-helix domain-containing protein n=1 Tax=Paenibacillus apiarius TaxID=46240 RepID=A0ABT4DTT9_9BACL|nr:helix-turn-helix transcriptional regulator [Paenibacillus apiarius]MBN3527531.1 helix-turn-helix transcriptional regulator [Paenibacillus apiarius]MCY9515862.1 helix-turn-helix domain-containing protein [Paenibacillus apiarius]MCY9520772.1 helix-turn-helix domain-containing protein [Paenibacillus apiarius]MCY9553476.1 helix-turn-helix domain-containing protein [Paenibacillus apiarius]MCY9558000.1 helix-turn-helix domain-containing protein [Paenibacillus apiarius]